MRSDAPLTESYFYILLCLYAGPNHGYGIMQMAAELSHGAVQIGSGTMYGATSNMMKKGWIVEIENENSVDGSGGAMDRFLGRRKRLYQLTDIGCSILLEEINRLIHLLESVNQITHVNDSGSAHTIITIPNIKGGNQT